MKDTLPVTMARQARDQAKATFKNTKGDAVSRRINELALERAERDLTNALAQQVRTHAIEAEHDANHVRLAAEKKQAIRRQFFVEHPEVNEDRFEDLWPDIEVAHDQKIVTEAVVVARQSGRYRI